MNPRMALVLVGALAACTEPPDRGTDSAQCCTVAVRVNLSGDAGDVYLTGNQEVLGPWRPDVFPMTSSGLERSAQIEVPAGTEFEYKFTLGSWNRQALGPSGTVLPNFRVLVEDHIEVRHEIGAFQEDPETYIDDWQGSGVQGSLVYWKDVESRHLAATRHVGIWLPPGYDADRRYPVLYMHDGQNLFDPRLTGNGEIWDVDDAVVRLVDSGTIPPVIVVGVFNSADRLIEYSPWHGAPDYARFLIEELIPRVNESFATLSGPKNTAVMGSSMGGLLSYYLVTYHPDAFGACGCISSHFSLSDAALARFSGGDVSSAGPDDTPYILRDIENGLAVPDGVRYWFDYGTEGLDAQYHEPHQAIRQWLLRQGLRDGVDFAITAYDGADHNEASWRERLDEPLTFLFAPPGVAPLLDLGYGID